VTELDGRETEIGVCRYAINPDGESCEFALVVSDQWQHRAVGHRLMGALMEIAHHKGLKTMEGEVLSSNSNMLKLVATLGFSIADVEADPGVKKVVRVL
jgi:acetyltransferase